MWWMSIRICDYLGLVLYIFLSSSNFGDGILEEADAK